MPECFRKPDFVQGALHRLLKMGEKILFVVGAGALAIYAFFNLQMRAYQAHEKQLLQHAINYHTPVPGPAGMPAPGQLIGEIQIPRVGISTVILEGTAAGTLRLGIGHIAGTPFPGDSGNMSLAGHRDTFFRPLRKVRKGDVIRVITPSTTYEYVVDWTRIVPPQDTKVLASTPVPTLTLVTCYPFYYVGAAPNRFIVRAHRMRQFPSAKP